eukprot:EG_transcript_30284
MYLMQLLQRPVGKGFGHANHPLASKDVDSNMKPYESRSSDRHTYTCILKFVLTCAIVAGLRILLILRNGTSKLPPVFCFSLTCQSPSVSVSFKDDTEEKQMVTTQRTTQRSKWCT